MFITGQGGVSFALGGPTVTQAWEAYFSRSTRPTPVWGPTPLTLWTDPIFHHQNFSGPVSGMGGVGPWPGVGAVEGEKYAPPRAGEWAGVGNFAGGTEGR